MLKSQSTIKGIFSAINTFVSTRAAEDEYQFVALGILAIIGFPFFYLIWHDMSPQAYENFHLRLVAGIIAIPLILHRYFPVSLRFLKPWYWYLTLLYLIPFFFTYMLLRNDGSTVWQLNGMMALILLILLIDWLMVAILYLVGVSIATVCYILTVPEPHLPTNTINIIASYIPVLIYCGFFLFQRSQVQKERLQVMQALGAMMAHEMRVPLRAVCSGLEGIGKRLTLLIEAYKKSSPVISDLPYLSKSDCESLPNVFNNIQSETKAAFNVIDMLLVKADLSGIDVSRFTSCSIKSCIKEAIARYPFKSGEQDLIHIPEGDFEFHGNATLIEHVLFNLLKNALYYVKAAGKGEIIITYEVSSRYNILRFKDTGSGIPSKVLPHIFDRFYSKTPHGTGVGLFFCQYVMHSLGGDISCDSVENQYTEFTLRFPRRS